MHLRRGLFFQKHAIPRYVLARGKGGRERSATSRSQADLIFVRVRTKRERERSLENYISYDYLMTSRKSKKNVLSWEDLSDATALLGAEEKSLPNLMPGLRDYVFLSSRLLWTEIWGCGFRFWPQNKHHFCNGENKASFERAPFLYICGLPFSPTFYAPQRTLSLFLICPSYVLWLQNVTKCIHTKVREREKEWYRS